ncbi:Alpha/Beta hydrolase protein [Chytridium lagenaria]|nr:Alpha/Beta hydrolase protein [Chytridium lagenaria]
MNPQDPNSFNHNFAVVNGIRLHYVDHGTGPLLVLVHGFPDIWYGWRYQIKPLVDNGFRVIVPDLRGYGQSDAPRVEPGCPSIEQYGWKNLCKDLCDLVDHVLGSPNSSAIYIGHDWGGMIVWRMCLHFPHRIKAVASICTAYAAPLSTFLSNDDVVKFLPQFAYQRWLAMPETDQQLDANADLFFRVIFRPWQEDTVDVVDLGKRGLESVPSNLRLSNMITRKEFDYYVNQYTARGFHGGLNLYRTRKVNFDQELGLNKFVNHPALMISATHDKALPPSMTKKMPVFVKNVTFKEVEAAHWAQVEQASKVSQYLLEWLSALISGKLPSKL